MSQPDPAPVNPAPPALPTQCDVLVVGGGINGAGIARDLAGRGLNVVLCEKDDLAAHTSSSSTKLIHGGLRYLEYFEFALVRKSLTEREVLLQSAPHIMWPLRFVMPHDPNNKALRPVWMIRLGLFLYDHLARRRVLPASSTVDLRRHVAGAALKPVYTTGFVYSDGWVDDARLVVLNAVDAAQRGATVLTHWRCTQAVRGADHWQLRLQHRSGAVHGLRARALVNATGPWAAQFLNAHVLAGAAPTSKPAKPRALRLVKGSHIVVNKRFQHDHAYIFQNADKRIIFAIPFEGDFTLLGTTDVEHQGDIGGARIDAAEVQYLCDQASLYFKAPVMPSDVVWAYSGVRPLLDDESGNPAAVTRDYALELDLGQGLAPSTPSAPLLTVWGGKLTTFRKLAEEAADLLATPLGNARGAWTASTQLPGGDLAQAVAQAKLVAVPAATHDLVALFESFVQTLQRQHPQLPAPLCRRLARCYGTRAAQVLAGPQGAEVAPGLFEGELHHLHQHEWAQDADDVLWRRTKLGLHYTPAQRAAVAAWCQRHWPTDTPAPGFELPVLVAVDQQPQPQPQPQHQPQAPWN